MRHNYSGRQARRVALAVLFLIQASPSFAALAVFDPQVFGKSVEQIQQLRQALEVAKEAVALQKQTYDAVHGINNYGRSMQSEINGYMARYNQLERSLSNLDLGDDVKDVGGVEDIQKALDVMSGSKLPPGWKGTVDPVRKDYAQKSYREALAAAEGYIGQLEDQNKRIGDITLDIDQAQTLKDSLDLGNKIAAQTLRAVYDMSHLLAENLKITAVERFKGVDTSKKAQFKDKPDWMVKYEKDKARRDEALRRGWNASDTIGQHPCSATELKWKSYEKGLCQR